jgi:hypothetical protein
LEAQAYKIQQIAEGGSHAHVRRAMGQDVFVLDPFGESGLDTASHNPSDELNWGMSMSARTDSD